MAARDSLQGFSVVVSMVCFGVWCLSMVNMGRFPYLCMFWFTVLQRSEFTVRHAFHGYACCWLWPFEPVRFSGSGCCATQPLRFQTRVLKYEQLVVSRLALQSPFWGDV